MPFDRWTWIPHKPEQRFSNKCVEFHKGQPCEWPDCNCTHASYQERVDRWMRACFGPAITEDMRERNHRFLEEALELVQATGCSRFEAHALVDYVFTRPVGNAPQEVGGVQLTLAALCNAAGINIDTEAVAELARVWGKMDQIRAKQAAKPPNSPLPQSVD